MIHGIYRTRVGYTGGTTQSPTYTNMGDHTEAMQVDFDPETISFAEIANLFWQMHNPCASAYSRQYMSAIWYHDEAQRQILDQESQSLKNKRDQEIKTPVLPVGRFYLAEDYHQKYRLQGRKPLMQAFQEMYPVFGDFNNSTAAARVNGFLTGHGSKRMYESESPSWGIESTLLQQFVRV